MAELNVKRGRGRPPGAKNKQNGIGPIDPGPKKAPKRFPVNPKVIKEIRRLAEETRISPQQIFDDLLDNGLIAVRAMYVGLIEQRKSIKEQLETVLNPRSAGAQSGEYESAREGARSSVGVDQPGEDEPDAPLESGGLEEAPIAPPEEVPAEALTHAVPAAQTYSPIQEEDYEPDN